ncbi:DUF2642 domain-containing protein [Aneurinibacillus tyrosinisolvens]|uniref:DUF2642 domain-containing protein n=1 Tax=Aneurinibacillus tyrosinisolvens TaxID=1443435 RepID=UPI00063F127B|nr:DUF2642 domain-containing protein [Aneurinibacillus tyrosinisolvens]
MQTQMRTPDFQSLLGKTIKINKGGSESRTGLLLAVKPDHLVLQSAEDGILYYHTNHIKSVIGHTKDEFHAAYVQKTSKNNENTPEAAAAPDAPVAAAHIDALNFQDLLIAMENEDIRIDRGGPESRIGRLLSVQSDYIILQTEQEGVLFYLTHHIRNVSIVVQEAAASGQPEAVAAVQEAPVYPKAENYAGLLQGLQYSWVRINRGGPESIEGVLVESTDRELTLVVNQEVYRIPVFHMRNIGQIVAQAQQAQQENTEDASAAAGNQENQAESSTESNDQQSANEKSREKRSRDYIRASSRSNLLNSRSSREQSESTANLPRRLSQTLHFLSDTLSVPLDDLAAPYQRRRF